MWKYLFLAFVFLFFLVFCAFAVGSTGPPQTNFLDSHITEFMESRHIPGLAAGIVKNGQLIWTGSFGHAYFMPRVKVSDDTLFMLASISKTFTGTALMQLWENGLFDLHDSVDDYLHFQITHPTFPGTEITFHMLLTHTSGINDNWDNMPYFPGDSPLVLGEYLEDYFVPGGSYYDADRNFTDWEPGTRYVYCNVAIALAGYMVEVLSGTPFDEYFQQNVFLPLQMNETAWFLADLNISHIAMPYHWNGTTYEAYGHFGYTDYPAGALRTSAPQLLNLLTAYLYEGWFGGNRILESSTVAMMTTPQIPDIFPSVGLIWHSRTVDGRFVWGHGGGDFGVRTLAYFCPAENSAVVLLSNGESSLSALLDPLFDYATHYPSIPSRNLESRK